MVASPNATPMRVELFNDFNSGWKAFDDVRVHGHDTTKTGYLNVQRIALHRDNLYDGRRSQFEVSFKQARSWSLAGSTG